MKKMWCFLISLYNLSCFIVSAETSLIRQQLGNTNLYISIPSDFDVRKTEGMDFTVYYFNSADTISKENFSFGLYFGDHPSSYKRVCEKPNTDTIEGKLINKPCKWVIYSCDDSYFIETVIQKNDSDFVELDEDVHGKGTVLLISNNKIHAFGNSDKKEDLDLILDFFSTLEEE